MSKKIGVIGAGAWGTALAMVAARSGSIVKLWSNRNDIVESINVYHKNCAYLTSYSLANNISATFEINDLEDCDLLLLVVPAQKTREVLEQIKHFKHAKFVICNKGIENSSLMLMSEIIEEIMPKAESVILSGPNFAEEIAQDLPAITSISGTNPKLVKEVCDTLNNSQFRTYGLDDMVGVQICGAVKNVIAIACGICIGKGLGENAKAAIITRGLSEIYKLIKVKNGKTETLLSPAGIGDLTLTCGSTSSRNMAFGYELGKNKKFECDFLVEGAYTVKSINALAKKYNIDLPISNAVEKIIENPSALDQIIYELLNRPLPVN